MSNKASHGRPERIIREAEVAKRTGLSRGTIQSLIEKGGFPAPIAPSPRTKGWLESEINAWIEERVRASRDPVRAASAKAVRNPNRWMRRSRARDQLGAKTRKPTSPATGPPA